MSEQAPESGLPSHANQACPQVSIILPTHNGSKYLDQSIHSCIQQTFRDWELIIVDDCSTDATPQLIEKWKAADPRIRSIRHEANKRLPGALNTGHDAARGRYLTWTSDDNLYRPEALAEMHAYLESNPRIGLVYCDYTEVDDAGAVIARRTVGPPQDLAFFCVVGACFLFRCEVHRQVGGYREDLFCAEDYEYWMRVSRHFTLAPLHNDLYLYRLHGGSLTATKQDRVLEAMKRGLQDNLPGMRWAGRRPLARGWLAVASIAARRREIAQASAALARALGYAPGQTLGHLFRGAARRLRGGASARTTSAAHPSPGAG